MGGAPGPPRCWWEPANRFRHSRYFNDLTLVNFSTARSDNYGATWPCSNTGVPDAVVDRQWYAIDGDPVSATAPAPSVNSIYLANDEIGPGGVVCGTSVGNNVLVMYRSPIGAIPNASAGIQFGPRQTVTALLSCDEGIMGNNEVSPVATTLNDANPNQPLAVPVRHVFVGHDNAAFDAIYVGRCTPVSVAVDLSGLQCTDHLVSSFPSSPQGVRRTGANFPSIAIDNAGTIYIVWEQAVVDAGNHVGDSALMYSFSTDEGNVWAAPRQIATGLPNNIFAWIAAGDAGRVDVMFLGTTAHVNHTAACPEGPDSINGIWNVYMVQSLAASTATPGWTAAIPASNHYIHKGSIQTVVGGQCGDRTLGDFFQIRVGSQGEANLSFADSNNIDEPFLPHAMYVKQVGGNSLYAAVGTVSFPQHGLRTNSVTDVGGDGRYEAGGVISSANDPDLDITGSSLARPAAASCAGGIACYRVTMNVADLTAMPLGTAACSRAGQFARTGLHRSESSYKTRTWRFRPHPPTGRCRSSSNGCRTRKRAGVRTRSSN